MGPCDAGRCTGAHLHGWQRTHQPWGRGDGAGTAHEGGTGKQQWLSHTFKFQGIPSEEIGWACMHFTVADMATCSFRDPILPICMFHG